MTPLDLLAHVFGVAIVSVLICAIVFVGAWCVGYMFIILLQAFDAEIIILLQAFDAEIDARIP